MTGIIVGSVAGAAGVFYSRPVFDPTGGVIGAVVMRIKAEPIGQMLAQARVGNERTPFLIDNMGVVVWHPDETDVQEPHPARARRSWMKSRPTSASAAPRATA